MPHITPLHLLGYGDSPESTASPVILGQSPYCCPKQRLLQPMSIGFAMTYTTNDCKDMFHVRTLLPLTLPSPASGEGETLGLSWYCLYQLTLKNVPDARRSKPPTDSIVGRHTFIKVQTQGLSQRQGKAGWARRSILF